MTATARVDVLIVCSSGGHLTDAMSVAPAWSERSRAWVSFDKSDVRSLLAGERLYIANGPTNRNIPNFARNLWMATRVIAETRPRVVLTTGAGVGVPFAWVARLHGAKVIYLECAGRVDRPSLSGRLIAPIAARLYAQWPDLAAAWPGAEYAGNMLLTGPGEAPPDRGTGVVVTVGTNEARFDRLLEAVTHIPADSLTVQHGPSAVRPSGATCHDYLPFGELDRLMGAARVVVTHAGIGSVATALHHGRRPVVVPRLRCFKEAVDDHQLFFARTLATAGLATLVEDVRELPEVVARDDHVAVPRTGPDLVAVIAGALDELGAGV